MKMLKLVAVILLSVVAVNVYAAENQKPLNRVILRVAAEQWVRTTSADVDVTIDASLGNEGLATARANIMKNLMHIADGEWMVTRFNRTKDRSGLERLSVSATARLKENQLAKLRDGAESITKPGETYRVSNIDFTPSLAEYEAARAAVRKELYMKVNAELARLNQTYPTQKFEVHGINFVGDFKPPVLYQAKQMMRGAVAEADMSAAPIAVSNKVKMTASVVLAS